MLGWVGQTGGVGQFVVGQTLSAGQICRVDLFAGVGQQLALEEWTDVLALAAEGDGRALAVQKPVPFLALHTPSLVPQIAILHCILLRPATVPHQFQSLPTQFAGSAPDIDLPAVTADVVAFVAVQHVPLFAGRAGAICIPKAVEDALALVLDKGFSVGAGETGVFAVI